MPAPLQPIAIQDLLADPQPQRLTFEQAIAGLETIAPVRGWPEMVVEGPLLRLEAEASASVELRCDRCLKTFVHGLRARVSERIGLGTSAEDLSDALDYDADGISEQIDPQGQFDPQQWIYEQLTLQVPLVNRCGPQCPGPDSWGSGDPPLDPRWAALSRLKP